MVFTELKQKKNTSVEKPEENSVVYTMVPPQRSEYFIETSPPFLTLCVCLCISNAFIRFPCLTL